MQECPSQKSLSFPVFGLKSTGLLQPIKVQVVIAGVTSSPIECWSSNTLCRTDRWCLPGGCPQERHFNPAPEGGTTYLEQLQSETRHSLTLFPAKSSSGVICHYYCLPPQGGNPQSPTPFDSSSLALSLSLRYSLWMSGELQKSASTS